MIRVIILGSLVFLAGCAVGPDYERPDLEPIVPEEYASAMRSPSICASIRR